MNAVSGISRFIVSNNSTLISNISTCPLLLQFMTSPPPHLSPTWFCWSPAGTMCGWGFERIVCKVSLASGAERNEQQVCEMDEGVDTGSLEPVTQARVSVHLSWGHLGRQGNRSGDKGRLAASASQLDDHKLMSPSSSGDWKRSSGIGSPGGQGGDTIPMRGLYFHL